MADDVKTPAVTSTGEDLTGTNLWSRFQSAGSDKEFWHLWMALQCQLLPGALQGVLVLVDAGSGQVRPMARWPESGEGSRRLAEVLDRTLEERCGILVELERVPGAPKDAPARYGLAYPIQLGDQMLGAVAIEAQATSADPLRRVMEQLQWGIAWLELNERRRQVSEGNQVVSRLRSAVDLVAAVLQEERFAAAALVFVTELATMLKCDRVSLGFLGWRNIKIEAISHTARIDTRMNLPRMIREAMEESLFAGREIRFPAAPHDPLLVSRSHEKLSRDADRECVLSLPFRLGERFGGALTLERGSDHPFQDEEILICQSVLALAGPVLEERRKNDRWIVTKILDSAVGQVAQLIGPANIGRKITVIVLVLLVWFLSFARGMDHLGVDTVLEGRVKRAVVAPFNGYIKLANVRAGDVIKEGDVLCELDDRDLRLERWNWLTKRTQFQRELQEAFARNERAKVKIIEAQLQQAEAQIKLVETQLERLLLKAPLGGLVLSGDLSQRLGGFVSEGEVLFELAPLDEYRVILRVDERRIDDMAVGQKGRALLHALTERELEFVVEKITPITTTEGGRNYYRVEAKLLTHFDRLRPGMEGVAKVDVGEKLLIVIWTGDLRDWIRMMRWKWWG